MFITFEGPDGAGKTTQIALLARRLTAGGCEVVTTREPGGTAVGALIRSLLLDSSHELSAVTEAYLMTADRAEHMRQVIGPALDRGAVVISDRFLDSTLAYQGGGRGLDMDDLQDLQKLATQGLRPDVTLLLDLPAAYGLKRKFDREPGNRLDHESIEFHQRVADTYRALALAEPARWRIIDATEPVELVHTAIWLHVTELLNMDRATLVRGQNV